MLAVNDRETHCGGADVAALAVALRHGGRGFVLIVGAGMGPWVSEFGNSSTPLDAIPKHYPECDARHNNE